VSSICVLGKAWCRTIWRRIQFLLFFRVAVSPGAHKRPPPSEPVTRSMVQEEAA
jgi:hypothetical protein